MTTTKKFRSDMTNAPPAARLVTRLMARMVAMRTTAKANMDKAQRRYKADYDKAVTRKEFHRGQWVFVDRAPNTSQTPAEKLAGDAHSKLLPKATGPFIVKKVGSHTLTIEENGVDNTITADRATLCTTRPTGETSRPIVLSTLGNSHGNHNHNGETSLDKPHGTLHETNTRRPQEDETQEYAVDRIVGHTGHGAERKYIVRWYGYTQAEDTAEPPSHIPPHFIQRYWTRVHRRMAKRGKQ